MSKTVTPVKSAESVPEVAKRCVACAGEASSKIVRDDNFEKVMLFYWQGLSLDVKPKDMKTHELCGTCWDSLVEFYDTNDVLVLMENHLRKLQKALISQAAKGIETLNKDGQPLLNVHKLFTEKWGDGIKSDDDDEPKEVSVTTYLEDPKPGTKAKPADSVSKSTSKSASPATRGGGRGRGRSLPNRSTRKPASRKRKNDTEDETSEDAEETDSDPEYDPK